MSPSSRGLCVISEDQRREYEAELARMSQCGIDLVFESSPEVALPLIGKLHPDLIVLGTAIEDFEGIEILAMIMNRYKDFDRPIVVLPEKEDGLPAMLHSRSRSTGKSSVEAVSVEMVIELVAPARQEPPVASPAAPPARSEERPEAEPDAASDGAGSPPLTAGSPPLTAEIRPMTADAPPPAPAGRAIVLSVVIGASVMLLAGVVLLAFLGGGREKQGTGDEVSLDAASPAGEHPVEVAEQRPVEDGEPVTDAEPPMERPTEELVLPIIFDRSKSVPKITDSDEMDAIIEALQRQPTARIVLTGHASSEGMDVDNYGLAMDRAKNVMELLVQLGIPANRFELKSLGATVPATSNETEEGRAMNRRVTIQLVP